MAPFFLSLLEQVPLASWFRTQVVAYALLNACHILSLGMFMGATLPLDLGILRTPGFGWTTKVAQQLRCMAIGTFVCTAFTGVLLFTVRPVDYLGNAAFLAKVSVLLLAAVNALLFQMVRAPRVRQLLAGLSLAMWLFVLLAGRWIGFD